MPKDPFVRENFTRLRQAAKKLAAEYFERYPKHRYQSEIESRRHLQSDNIEFILKRLREPISDHSAPPVRAAPRAHRPHRTMAPRARTVARFGVALC
jgi:hypothetical protein